MSTRQPVRGWWATKVRQFRVHVLARVSPAERDGLTGWLTPHQLAVFDGMHRADRRHGLDVVATLREAGVTDPDVLVAGLLHDCGKGDTGVWPRVAWSLGQRLGPWIVTPTRVLPGFGDALGRLRDHPTRSAELLSAAGCSPRTIDLVRDQERPTDPEYGSLLKLADEAN